MLDTLQMPGVRFADLSRTMWGWGGGGWGGWQLGAFSLTVAPFVSFEQHFGSFWYKVKQC